MAKITLRELRQLIREAVEEQMEEMAGAGVEESGMIGGVGPAAAMSRVGARTNRPSPAPEAVAAAEKIVKSPDFAALFAEFISLPDNDPRKADLAKMWHGSLKEAVRRKLRKIR